MVFNAVELKPMLAECGLTHTLLVVPIATIRFLTNVLAAKGSTDNDSVLAVQTPPYIETSPATVSFS